MDEPEVGELEKRPSDFFTVFEDNGVWRYTRVAGDTGTAGPPVGAFSDRMEAIAAAAAEDPELTIRLEGDEDADDLPEAIDGGKGVA